MSNDILKIKGGIRGPDPKDHRDYKAEELLAGVEVKRPSYMEGYSAVDRYWPDMPYKDQNRQSSCVGQAWAYYKQVLQAKDTGEKTEMSAKSIYNPIAIPYTGAYVRDGGMQTVNRGVNKESTVPSNGSEAEVTAQFDFKPYDKEAEFYRNRLIASVSTQDFEKLADLIYLNDGIVSGRNRHCMYFDGYGIMNGKKYLHSPNSYGDGNDLYYFEGDPYPLFSAWTAVDIDNIPLPSDALLADLKLGDKGKEVGKLKDTLIKFGWGRRWVNGQKIEDLAYRNNVYDDYLAERIMNFKLANICESVWSRFWERYVAKGRNIDSHDRQIINLMLSKK